MAGPDWSEIEENQLTEETWQEVGLDREPEISYTDYGGNGLLSVQKLPSQITETDIYNNSKTYEIQWILKLPACEEDYALTEVTQEDINNGTVNVGTPGWYYVRKTDFKFHIQWFMGGEELTDEMRHKAREQLQLNVRFENGSDWQDGETNLAELIDDGNWLFAFRGRSGLTLKESGNTIWTEARFPTGLVKKRRVERRRQDGYGGGCL